MAYTPRTLRRRKLLNQHNIVDPEFASLYHDEPMFDSSSPPLFASTPTANANDTQPLTPNKMILGTPRTLRHTQTQSHKQHDHSFSNMYKPSSLAERLEKMNEVEETNNNNNNKQIPFDTNDNKSSDSIFDLNAYEMVPDKMKEALAASQEQCLFSRDNFFRDESPAPAPAPAPQSSSSASNSRTSSPLPPTTMTAENPASPASSVTSVATSISECIDFSLLSWPGSPKSSSPVSNRFKSTSALSFGRVDQQSLHGPSSSHPLANELVNPFLEPTSPSSLHPDEPSPEPVNSKSPSLYNPSSPESVSSASSSYDPSSSPSVNSLSFCDSSSTSPSPPPSPVIKEIIPLSTRMQQRFSNCTIKQNTTRKNRFQSTWTITDASTSSHRHSTNANTTTIYKATSRQKMVRLQQRLSVAPTRRRRHQRIINAKKSGWIESSLSS